MHSRIFFQEYARLLVAVQALVYKIDLGQDIPKEHVQMHRYRQEKCHVESSLAIVKKVIGGTVVLRQARALHKRTVIIDSRDSIRYRSLSEFYSHMQAGRSAVR